MFDEWPWLDPYIEVEAADEKQVRTIAGQLGLDWKSAVFGDVMAAYREQYPHLTEEDTVATIVEFRFGDRLPDLLWGVSSPGIGSDGR